MNRLALNSDIEDSESNIKYSAATDVEMVSLDTLDNEIMRDSNNTSPSSLDEFGSLSMNMNSVGFWNRILSYFSPRGFVWLVSFFSSLSGFLFGLDVGIISGALLFMEKSFGLTNSQQEIVLSIVLVGSFVGSLTGGWLSDRLGRWRTIMIATIAYLTGALLMTFSVTSSLAMIYLGRLIIGYAIGVSTLTVTLYLAEIAPPAARGAIVSLNEVAIVTGIFLSFFLNWTLSGLGDDRAWRLAFGISAIPAAVQVFGMFLLPFSPRWLLSKGRTQEAVHILIRTRGRNEAEREFVELQQAVTSERSRTLKSLIAELFSPNMRWALCISMLLTFFQQACGQPTVLLYSSKIIKRTGIFPSNSTTLLAALIPGLVKLIMTILSSFYLIDHLGRRTLLLWGAGTIFVSLVTLGFIMLPTTITPALGWASLITITVFLGAYAASYGPISWLYMSEVYPQHLRALGMSAATAVNWASQAVFSFTFLSALDYWGPSKVFWFYATTGIFAFWFIYKYVPETKGKSLEELAAIFQSGNTSIVTAES